MATLTNTTQLARVRAAFDKRLLERLLPNLPHSIGAEKRPLAMRSGNQIKFRRIESLAANATPLTEGVTPTGTVLSDTKLTSTIAQHGDYVIITDIAEKTDEIALASEAVDTLAEQGAKSMDQVTRDVINAGTYYLRVTSSSAYSASGARVTVAYPIIKEALRAAVRQLESYDVKKFKDAIKAGPGVGSLPVPEAYICLVHPHVAYDLRHLLGETNGFIPVHKYSNYAGLYPGEIGALDAGVRFVSTSNGKIWTGEGAASTSYKYTGSNLDVYGCVMFGKGFYGDTEFEGGLKTIVQDFGSAGTIDPFKQRMTVAWLAEYVCTILNDYCGVRIECAASL